MTHDQDIVRQLQRRLHNWVPDGYCSSCMVIHPKNCEYNAQGQLIELHLCGLKLTQVPSGVSQLSALQRLYLGSNQLSTLPAEVGKLTTLRELDLSHNKLSTLPAEVGKLTALRELGLSHNWLTTLPAEVGELTALQELDLGSNQLTALPTELGKLTSLRWLNLSSNDLTALPVELGKLTSLHDLSLDDNPLEFPPPEIIAQGIAAIFAYLQPIKIFYCYAHEDRELRDRIEKHLGVLQRLGHIVGWYDREIQAGIEWKREIEERLSSANIILLLVSADFVHSDYCYGVEMRKALEMHEKGKAHVLPILLRPVDWQDAPFAKLQLLPTSAKPITRWLDPEEALEDVARQIRMLVNTLKGLAVHSTEENRHKEV